MNPVVALKILDLQQMEMYGCVDALHLSYQMMNL